MCTLMLVDAAGAVVVSSAPANASAVQAVPELVRMAVAQSEPQQVLTLAVPGPPNSVSTFLLGLGLATPDGRALGRLVAQIDSAQLAAALCAVRRSADTFLALAHGPGRLLALVTKRPVLAARKPGDEAHQVQLLLR